MSTTIPQTQVWDKRLCKSKCLLNAYWNIYYVPIIKLDKQEIPNPKVSVLASR